jgi:hypothetical protein
MRRALVIAANVVGAMRASAATASPTMMNSRSTDDRTSRVDWYEEVHSLNRGADRLAGFENIA